jgi:hypothetical protein
MDTLSDDVEMRLAMHEMALEGGQTAATRALFAQRDSARVHLVVERLARAVKIVAEPGAGRGITCDKRA